MEWWNSTVCERLQPGVQRDTKSLGNDGKPQKSERTESHAPGLNFSKPCPFQEAANLARRVHLHHEIMGHVVKSHTAKHRLQETSQRPRCRARRGIQNPYQPPFIICCDNKAATRLQNTLDRKSVV